MKRVYYHYTLCEEFRPDAMWRIVSGREEREQFIAASAALMSEPSRFLEAMLHAVAEWPHSCETNMTSDGTNHRAWFGHAGCFLATGSPEDCTRLGWHTLDYAQQYAANAAADEAIAIWWKQYQPVVAVRQLPLWEVSYA